jgi:hypothetical protein
MLRRREVHAHVTADCLEENRAQKGDYAENALRSVMHFKRECVSKYRRTQGDQTERTQPARDPIYGRKQMIALSPEVS